jgi:hypothetical protein
VGTASDTRPVVTTAAAVVLVIVLITSRPRSVAGLLFGRLARPDV